VATPERFYILHVPIPQLRHLLPGIVLFLNNLKPIRVMSKYRFFPLLFTVASLLLLVNTASAQHMVLFESFTNEAQPVITPNPRPGFNSEVDNLAAAKRSKAIHLNHHVGNQIDWLELPNSAIIGNRLFPASPGSYNEFYASIDRVNMPSTGGRYSADPSEWSQVIDDEAALPDVADLTLSDIKLDTITIWPDYILQTDVQVTLNQSISDSLMIRYALLQNNVPDRQNCNNCAANVHLNDVVRYLTISDTGNACVFTPGSAQGTVKHVICRQRITGATQASEAPWIYSDLRLVGFLEENPRGDYHIVNAAVLKDGMTGLAQPQKFLAIQNNTLDDLTFDAGDSSASFLWSGVSISSIDVFISTDNGATWNPGPQKLHGTSFPTTVTYWGVPFATTTQGKIKIVDHDDPSVFAIEQGTFSINVPSGVVWLHPDPNKLQNYDTVKGGTTYHLDWAKNGVSTVNVEYAYHVQGNPVWKLVSFKNAGTSFDWKVPDTSYIVDLRITPAETSVASAMTHMTITKSQVIGGGGVENVDIARDFAIRQVYPNPSAGQNVTVQYTSTKQKQMTLEVLDLLGHVAFSDRMLSMPSSDIQIPTASFAPGTYFVRLSDGEQAVTKRIEILK
jgi:hypothetical protein